MDLFRGWLSEEKLLQNQILELKRTLTQTQQALEEKQAQLEIVQDHFRQSNTELHSLNTELYSQGANMEHLRKAITRLSEQLTFASRQTSRLGMPRANLTRTFANMIANESTDTKASQAWIPSQGSTISPQARKCKRKSGPREDDEACEIPKKRTKKCGRGTTEAGQIPLEFIDATCIAGVSFADREKMAIINSLRTHYGEKIPHARREWNARHRRLRRIKKLQRVQGELDYRKNFVQDCERAWSLDRKSLSSSSDVNQLLLNGRADNEKARSEVDRLTTLAKILEATIDIDVRFEGGGARQTTINPNEENRSATP
eukprot:CAMPEP_0170188282 /NCGR_PEP_ID=MMETSP0040_2-20121228/43958_1 /TAXON_ID=641309 /ORGANISM="Lotharella oceanica, Strain CCMP622" /LENGTH=315 /DNA_ID=CAMNT_0010435549 /DNA_START=45 /DNA_END=992 /DNA_ORIENTATION=+